jgi:GcrA cell cycle regulator
MAWTEERVEMLKTLWVQGLSAAQIAKRLQGVSRNAVIGKIHRLGPTDRPARLVNRTYRSASVARVPGAIRVPRTADGAPRERIVRLVEEEPGLATAFTLEANMCKWPIGDPDDRDFSFCGRVTDAKRSYCDRHGSTAYRRVPAIGPGGLPADMVRLLARYA